MRPPYNNTLPLFSYSVVVAAVKLDLFARMLFMGRRKRSKYLTRTFFKTVPPRRY